MFHVSKATLPALRGKNVVFPLAWRGCPLSRPPSNFIGKLLSHHSFFTRRDNMAYIQPLVMVFQEYAKTSTTTPSAQLPPCIVGPCYHIIDPATDELLALAGQYTREGLRHCFFPNNRPGALIQKDSVHFRLKNAMAMLTPAPVPLAGSERNAIRFQDCLLPPGLETGDYALFFDLRDANAPARLGGEYRVIGRNAEANLVLLNKTAPRMEAGAAISVEFQRRLEGAEVAGDADGVFLDVTSERFDLMGQKVRVNGKECEIATAEVYVGYTALRRDLSAAGCLNSLDEIEGALGKVTPENPLAFGMSIALANTTAGVWYVGIDSDDLAGYTAAKDRLENEDPIYAIVPLTFAPSVLAMFKMHAEQMSRPEIGMWRIALGCSPLAVSKTLVEGRAILSRDGDGDYVVLTDEEGAFLSLAVDAGDELTLTAADGVEHRYVIAGAVSEDMLSVTQSNPFDSTVFPPQTPCAYRVEHPLDKTAQAKEIAATSKAYGSSRYVHIWPDICVLGDRELPGYYLACAVAGAVGGLPSHYGLTRLSIAGLDGLRHAGDYFNKDELNLIADGGTLIFVQASQAAPPHIRHQLTTDRSTVEFQELSFVKNFDYVSYICRDAMDVFLGKWNITPSTLASLETTLRGVLETLKLDNQPKIGSRILGYDIISVAQLDDVRDRVEMYAEVDFPYPLNTIGLHIISR